MSAATRQAGLNIDVDAVVDQIEYEESVREGSDDPDGYTDADWLQLASENWRASTTYWDSSLRREWEYSLSNFQVRHAPGSKYNQPEYANRSRLMRPKTRSLGRRHEAAAAAAFFSSPSMAVCSPANENDKRQQASAEAVQAALQLRLSRSIPWFQTVMGAYQNSMVQGAIASKTGWRYRDIITDVADLDQAPKIVDGREEYPTKRTYRVLQDEPFCDLIPLENVRFDPGADWTDPAQSSPYLILSIPMIADDVLTMMEQGETKDGGPKWRKCTLDQVLTHGRLHNSENGSTSSTSQARDGRYRQDRYETSPSPMYQTVWVREHFVRIGGEDWVFWTLGDSYLLSEPVPMEEAYLGRRRPVRIGVCMIEAFQAIPKSLFYLARSLQAAVDEVQNSRMDNVRLVLNKRYFMRNGARLDVRKLRASVPGGVVRVEDFNDLKAEELDDVTGSAYAEQDRLNADFDELMGSFSQGSVMTSRQLNETVGGMERMNATSDAVTEYQLLTFVMTWLKPTLQDLAFQIQCNETDETILALIGEQVQQTYKFGESDSIDALLEEDVMVDVDVGMGATDPVQRVQKFVMGVNSAMSLPGMAQRADGDEITREIFGRLGHRDGKRFFKPAAEMPEPPPDPKMLELKMKDQQFRMRLDADRDQFIMKLAAEMDMKVMDLQAKLGIGEQSSKTAAQASVITTAMREQGSMMREQNKAKELEFKAKTGRDGI